MHKRNPKKLFNVIELAVQSLEQWGTYDQMSQPLPDNLAIIKLFMSHLYRSSNAEF